jgi:hypothetical protein
VDEASVVPAAALMQREQAVDGSRGRASGWIPFLASATAMFRPNQTHLQQHLHDWSVEELRDHVAFDLTERTGLGLQTPGEAPFCRATLVIFQRRLRDSPVQSGQDKFQLLFDRQTRAQLERFGLQNSIQRSAPPLRRPGPTIIAGHDISPQAGDRTTSCARHGLSTATVTGGAGEWYVSPLGWLCVPAAFVLSSTGAGCRRSSMSRGYGSPPACPHAVSYPGRSRRSRAVPAVGSAPAGAADRLGLSSAPPVQAGCLGRGTGTPPSMPRALMSSSTSGQ